MCEEKETNMDTLNSAIDGTERLNCAGQGNDLWRETAHKQKATGMDRLDHLVYDPGRLVCTEREKDACLETVRKLVRLCFELRRNGVLVAGILAETEPDPFFRACLLEFELEEGYIEREDEPARLERQFAAYLAAGDYHGGAFLNAVLVTKGLLLLNRHLDAPPIVQGELLSVELRGFFGVEYRDRVIAAIKREIRRHAPRREASLLPAFDELAQLPADQRRLLLQTVEPFTLAMALRGAGAAVEDALMEVLEKEKLELVEREWDYDPNALGLFVKDVERAQSEIIALEGF